MPNADNNHANPQPAAELSEEELWGRCVGAADLLLSSEYKGRHTELCEQLLCTMHGFSLEKVKALDPKTFTILSADALKIAGKMVLHLAQIPARPQPIIGEPDGKEHNKNSAH